MKAELHPAETERLAALRGYDILDTSREADFDEIVRVVSAICETPISIISLVEADRQWFKAEVGLGVDETSMDKSMCAHAILQSELFVVPDTTKDSRFIDNPLVTGQPGVRFYAGALLQTSEGLPLGTVCVLDYKPRDLTENQRALLKLMADQIMKMFELRRLVRIEQELKVKAETISAENAILARESDHRVMNSLQLVSSMLSLQSRGPYSTETKSQLDDASGRVQAIANVHKQLHLAGSLEEIDIGSFFSRLCDSFKENAPVNIQDIKLTADTMRIRSDKASTMGLLVAELLANAFKYAYPDGQRGSIAVAFHRTVTGWVLEVADQGVGLPANFDPAKSTGVGMRIISALVRRLNATLHIAPVSQGTVFRVTSTN